MAVAVVDSYSCASGGEINAGRFGVKFPGVVKTDGAWCWFSDPRAIYASGKTFIGWISADGSVGISSYAHASKTVSSFVLHAALQVDDHDQPSILILPDGRIACFYCKHNTENIMRYRISDSAHDISSFGAEASFASTWGNPTYANPRYLSDNGKTYLHFRGWGAQADGICRSVSTTDFATWGSEASWFVQSGQRPYVKSITNNVDRIDFLLTNAHPNEAVSSVYHCYMQLDSGVEKFYKTDGTYIGTDTIAPSSCSLIHNGAGSRGWVWDIAYGADGHPRVLFSRFQSTTDHRYMFSRWTGSAWTAEVEITPAGGPLYSAETYYSGGICFDAADPDTVYLSAKVGSFFEIQQWETTDSGAGWAKTRDITSASSIKNARPVSPQNHNGELPLLWWAGTYTSYTNYSTDIMGLVA